MDQKYKQPKTKNNLTCSRQNPIYAFEKNIVVYFIFCNHYTSAQTRPNIIYFMADDLGYFTSDNGEERFSDNGIYKGRKMSLWEGGIREPAFIRWTGKIIENTVTNQVATTMDWTATILSLAGGKADPKFPLEGIDIMPILLGE